MKIKSLKLTNFRCFSDLKLEFQPKINLIIGDNAIGKTSVLEGICYLGLVKSFRTSRDNEICKFGNECFSVIGSIENGENNKKYKIIYESKNKKVYFCQTLYKKISDYLGTVLLVSYSNHDFIKMNGYALERRKIFEPIFCQISKDYLEQCNYYKKILNERNECLKRLKIANSKSNKILLETLDFQLVNSGVKIIEFRKSFINKINENLNEIHRRISSKNEFLDLVYKPNISINDFASKLCSSIEQDIINGTTSVGPHKDDYSFFVDNKDIIKFGSQGQQKNYMISLKMCFVKLIEYYNNQTPILLLDDVFSDLDRIRQNKLVEFVSDKIQTIIATATVGDIDDNLLKMMNVIDLTHF